ncbi:MAG TPA: NAD-dependent epimerase/dehydratase family protein [Acidimicrobiales bacterium]|nr:NAD-dependent epimerase/dehydratase family protein [Acidimicrobiales bacterium]
MAQLDKVVVTGGAGFIGANLCRHLVDTGAATEVVAFDNLSTGFAENVAAIPGVQLVEGDILDQAHLTEVLAGAAAVVHLAARPSVPKSIDDPLASHDNNATGTIRVLEAMRSAGVAKVVVASSSSVYGANPAMPKVETLTPMPVSPYAASKLAAESYTLSYQRVFGLEAVAFRFFNVFGPLQRAGHAYAAVVPAFVDAALAGRPLPIHGDGGQTRDFTYVGSVAEVITEVGVRGVASLPPVNRAFGTRYSLLELIELLEKILEHPLERAHLDPRAGDVRDSQADQTALRALVPNLEPVDFEAGLRQTVDWFRSL